MCVEHVAVEIESLLWPVTCECVSFTTNCVHCKRSGRCRSNKSSLANYNFCTWTLRNNNSTYTTYTICSPKSSFLKPHFGNFMPLLIFSLKAKVWGNKIPLDNKTLLLFFNPVFLCRIIFCWNGTFSSRSNKPGLGWVEPYKLHILSWGKHAKGHC